MAKKKELKKQPKKKEECCGTVGALMALAVLVAIGVLVCCVYGCFDSKASPRYEVGDCVLSRAFDLLAIEYVNETYEEYELRPTLINRDLIEPKWFLTRNFDKDRITRSFKFVEQAYTKIPCTSKEVPDEN